ncbi:S1C family serine protease [Haloferula chungangensis]|uniref:S1C family serine protease n=1 Tax=Haloferula chungangensis TaxID=1048331 RepID=A0ABW2L5X4_9BACT
MIRLLLAFALLPALPLSGDTTFPVDESPADHDSGDSVILAGVTPAIVSVFPARLLEDDEQSESELMDRFFNLDPDASKDPDGDFQGVGSGVILTSDGLIVTNSHVVHLSTGELADSITVELTDRRRFQARILGADRLTDIALLKVDATNLPVLPIANSDQVRVGDKVFAVGNPFKIGLTATKGMVSALNRSGLNLGGPGSYESFIQTDAPINPGNSGGALADSRGRLVGINTAIYSGAGGNVGIGFAVPSNLARHICTRLLEDGEVKRGLLGIKVRELTASDATRLRLEKISGVLVDETLKGGPAAEAGVLPGDLIVSVDGREALDRAAFRIAVSLHKPGDDLRLTLRRGEMREALELTAVLADPEESGAADAEFELLSLPGVKLKQTKRGEREGLEVIELPEDPALSRKLAVGMLIIEVNGKPTPNFAAAEATFRQGVNEVTVLHEGHESVLALRLDR